jgi:hypothetical protein
MIRFIKHALLLCTAPVLLTLCASAQSKDPVPAVLIDDSLTNQLYVGYQHSSWDYGLQVGSKVTRATTNGLDAQYSFKQFGKIGLLGAGRYADGSPLGEKLLTFAGGASYTFPIHRYRPFGQALLGYSRLTSDDHMHLYDGGRSGFTTLVGGGVDIGISERWAMRPIYVENQYLSFGSKHSFNWNIGGGIVYRFNEVFRVKKK